MCFFRLGKRSRVVACVLSAYRSPQHSAVPVLISML